jgi:hypothetical protein
MKDVGKINGHLVYFTAISRILRPFGIFRGQFGIFSQFWYVLPRKIWQPWLASLLYWFRYIPTRMQSIIIDFFETCRISRLSNMRQICVNKM